MHEEQDSRSGIVNALGWDWDMSSGQFSCPCDKYINFCCVMNEWATRAAANELFTYTEIDSLTKLFQWVSAACPSIISSVVSLQSLKHNLNAQANLHVNLMIGANQQLLTLHPFFMSDICKDKHAFHSLSVCNNVARLNNVRSQRMHL